MITRFFHLIMRSSLKLKNYRSNNPDAYEINLNEDINKKSDFVKAKISNQIITLEFFGDAKEVTISVADITGTMIYQETTDVCQTLHRFIYLNEYMIIPEYCIKLHNTSGIHIMGTFKSNKYIALK